MNCHATACWVEARWVGCSRGMLDHPVLDDVVAQHGTDELDAPRPLESGEAWHVARRKPHADRLQYDELAIIPLGEEALEKGSADEEEGHRRVALHVRVPLQRRLERVEAAVLECQPLRHLGLELGLELGLGLSVGLGLGFRVRVTVRVADPISTTVD